MLSKKDIQRAIDERLPLVTRGGQKAHVYANLNEFKVRNEHTLFCIQGYICGDNIAAWKADGSFSYREPEHINDLVGFWCEKYTATITVPCPLAEPRKDMYFLGDKMRIVKSIGAPHIDSNAINNCFYFGSAEEAEEFRDAIISICKG